MSYFAIAIIAGLGTITADAVAGLIYDQFTLGRHGVARRWYAPGRRVVADRQRGVPLAVRSWEDEDGPTWVKVVPAGADQAAAEWVPLASLHPVPPKRGARP
ncbi:MAG: hypothetical protein J2P25_04800 [Nocardiopsaceae bacterium]|nr:hypothetical protein [Nocardiopsaceae bacterium]